MSEPDDSQEARFRGHFEGQRKAALELLSQAEEVDAFMRSRDPRSGGLADLPTFERVRAQFTAWLAEADHIDHLHGTEFVNAVGTALDLMPTNEDIQKAKADLQEWDLAHGHPGWYSRILRLLPIWRNGARKSTR